jgi:hypothetical protein
VDKQLDAMKQYGAAKDIPEQDYQKLIAEVAKSVKS